MYPGYGVSYCSLENTHLHISAMNVNATTSTHDPEKNPDVFMAIISIKVIMQGI
jgi:hypothetical protein